MGHVMLLLLVPVLFYAGYQAAGGGAGWTIDWKNTNAVRSGWWTMNLYVVGTAVGFAIAGT